ncbi:ribonuclease H-like domain-containing protein [Tanacetum coccineum]
MVSTEEMRIRNKSPSLSVSTNSSAPQVLLTETPHRVQDTRTNKERDNRNNNKTEFIQLDVKNAFLHGSLSETVYMHQPPGFRDPRHPDHVCLLQRSLYGLKQAPRAWFQRFAAYAAGWFSPQSRSLLQRIIASLHAEFSMTDLDQVLERAGMLTCNSCRTPVDTDFKLAATGDPVSDPTLYRRLAGALQYLTFTRPDISYAVQQVCLFMHDPREPHFSALKRICSGVYADWVDVPLHVASTSSAIVVMDTPIISISSEESVGSHDPRVILFGVIPAIIPVIPEVSIVLADPIVAPKVGAVLVVSPTGVLDLVDYSYSFDSDPSDSLPPAPNWPIGFHDVIEAFRRWRSAPLSTPYPLTTSESSLGSSSERSLDSSLPFSRPSRKRCRSPTASVPSPTHVSRLIAPTHADLLPPRKRFRVLYSPEDSGEEHMEVDTADAEAITNVGISEGVVAHPEDGVGMGFKIATSDVKEDDEEFEAEASVADTREIVVDPLPIGIVLISREVIPDLEDTIYDIVHFQSKVHDDDY